MKRLMVYSHDTYGLGNIRRMLTICHYLLDTIPDLSILLVTGSPMIHSFRLPERLDYIKLPCLSRTAYEGYTVKSLGTEMGETMQLRSDLLLSAVRNFKPDLLLVDKKPYGVKRELEGVLRFIRDHFPKTKVGLILRDVLDSPAATEQTWATQGYYEAVRLFYDHIFVLGLPEIFDSRTEYNFPPFINEKLVFCGYLERALGRQTRAECRQDLHVNAQEKLVLVTPGGGADGYEILHNYVSGLKLLPPNVHSLLISGPEMPIAERRKLAQACADDPRVTLLEFTDDLMSYMAAADVVIAMAGYNTIGEILTLRKKALVIPRVHPTQEQLMRAERMAACGLFTTLHPEKYSPASLMQALLQALANDALPPHLPLTALPYLAERVSALLPPKNTTKTPAQSVAAKAFLFTRNTPIDAGLKEVRYEH